MVSSRWSMLRRGSHEDGMSSKTWFLHGGLCIVGESTERLSVQEEPVVDLPTTAVEPLTTAVGIDVNDVEARDAARIIDNTG